MTLNNSQQLLQQASVFLQQRRPQQAVVTLRKALKLNPRSSQALNMLGVALLYKGDLLGSKKAFQKSIKINPSDPGPHSNLGSLYTRQKEFESAARAYQSALSLKPNSLDILYRLALTYRKTANNDRAKSLLKKLLNLSPAHSDGNAAIGLIYQDEGDNDKANYHYDKCLDINPRSLVAIHNKAVILKSQKEYEAALVLLTQAVKINPKIADIHQNMGSCYASLGETALAVKAFEKALQLEPLSTSHHHWLNQMLWVEGSSDFLKSYHNAIKRAPESHFLRRELVYKLTLAGDLDEASEQSKYLLQHDSKNPSNFKLYGVVLRKQKKFEQAVITHLQALQMDPDNLSCQEELATSHLSNGDYKKAMPVISGLIAQDDLHQGYIALKSTALRIAESDEYYALCDYETLVLKTIIETPQGYSSLAEFNQELQSHLTDLHQNQRQPLDQSLMHGTQTIDDLFECPSPVIKLLRNCFDEQMHSFLKQLPVDASHPTLARNTHKYNYSGAWSVLLRKQGFHLNHFHSHGWYSGPYYIHLPDAVHDETSKQGWVKFGEPGFDSVVPLPADLIVKPEPGLMVRFPSFVWHGTIPFESDETRMVVALDLDPV